MDGFLFIVALFSAVLFLELIYFIYLRFRCKRVAIFRRYILNICHRAETEAINNGTYDFRRYDKVLDHHSFEDMLYSIKPLKIKYWFTKEEIEFLNKYNNEV